MKATCLLVVHMACLIGLALPCSGQTALRCDAARWVLIYSGGLSRPRYSVDDLTRYVAVVDSVGHPRTWLTTGAVFLELQGASGNYLTAITGAKPATGADWVQYLDSLFAQRGVLRRLDSAVARVASVLGPRRRPFQVAIMIPYPDPRSGTVTLWGSKRDFRSNDGRAGASVAYAREVTRRFRGGRFGHLNLEGFYWLMEGAGTPDTGLIHTVADGLHSLRTKFYWISDFFDFTRRHWTGTKALGFDQAWLQPNFFIDTMTSPARIDSALALARAQGVGIELEVDKRLFSSQVFAKRLEPYLVALDSAPDLLAGPLALYEGSGALLRLANSKDATLSQLYRHLARTFQVPASAAKACN